MRAFPSTIALLAITACGGGPATSGFSSGVGSVATSPGGSSSSTADLSSTSTSTGEENNSTTSTSTSSSSAVDSAPVLDMAMPDFGPQQPEGCKGKIDFLFVVSADGTMEVKQDRLLASFPGFMAAIEEQLPGFDVHILSADSDGGWLQKDCSLCTDDCDPEGSPPFCGAALEPCDQKLGAGVTFPAGAGASNRRCELASGARYIDNTEPDRTAAFTCIAQVGIGGDTLAAEAMVKALEGPGNCNDGFLRDDALLVVTIIQDTYDQFSAGTVDTWKKALQDAKSGDDDAFALLVLTTDVDVGYQQLCKPNLYNETKNPLRLLAESVEHGFIGSICAPSYEPFFAETVASLATLCEEFVPPG